MSVRIVRTRSGEDIISDIYEVTPPTQEGAEETKDPIAYQLRYPYSIYTDNEEQPNIEVSAFSEDSTITKQSEPKVVMEPWAPLSKSEYLFFRLDEVVAAYETYDAVVEQYNNLVEAQKNG